jgi:hypothetical protein
MVLAPTLAVDLLASRTGGQRAGGCQGRSRRIRIGGAGDMVIQVLDGNHLHNTSRWFVC